MKLLKIKEVTSTNTWLQEHADDMPAPFAVSAYSQIAGRGQRGNHWEAEAGKNVTLSVLFRPKTIKASDQFVISQAVAVAITETLRHYLPMLSKEITIKWPNDIYVGDSKICGVLIENAINGQEVTRSIIGIGLNVNQRVFLSDAPNPVSMRQLAGHDFDVDEVAKYLVDTIEKYSQAYSSPHRYGRLRGRFFSLLWRRTGYYPYEDAATGQRFDARITTISPMGIITLAERDGTTHSYAFKEVKAIL